MADDKWRAAFGQLILRKNINSYCQQMSDFKVKSSISAGAPPQTPLGPGVYSAPQAP